ncbi:unnamed protein product [Polarella glacialis]|uniref:RING-type domain-containing protein n=1 Tax=Polarella glacialis TaxID=89957 RepID=A0A813IVT1_POLGL|nr:unnamed protein product [Polarella glacialis]
MSSASGAEGTVDDFTCPICLVSPIVDPVTSPCGHSFDQACFAAFLRRSHRRSGCPVCRKPLAGATPEVSLLLRDALARLYPQEVRQRRESQMHEELEGGHASVAVLTCLAARLRSAFACTDVGSLTLMLSLFIEALTGSTNDNSNNNSSAKNVDASRALLALIDAAWSLLKRAPCSADAEALPAVVEDLVQAVETLVDHLLDSHPQTAGDLLDGMVGTAVTNFTCVWSSAPHDCAGRDSRGQSLRLSVLLLECLLLALGRLQRRLRGQTVVGAAGMLLATLCEARAASAGDGCSSELASARVAAFRAAGSLAVLVGSRVADAELVWADLREELVGAVCHGDVPSAAAAAQACGAFLDAELCPPESLGAWLARLLLGVHVQLATPEAAADSASARRLLALLGDSHRFVPGGASSQVLAELVGDGRFSASCSLIESAGRVVNGDHVLLLGVLEAWEGVIAFLKGIPATDVEVGFAPWVGQLVTLLVWALMQGLPDAAGSHIGQEEAFESIVTVLGDLLQLTSQVGGALSAALLPQLRQQPLALERACGPASTGERSASQRWVHTLCCQLGLLDRRTAGHITAAPAATFGGRGTVRDRAAILRAWRYTPESGTPSAPQASTSIPSQGRRIVRARRRGARDAS